MYIQAYIPRPGRIGRLLRRIDQSRITHVDTLLSAPTPLLEDPSDVPELRIYATMPLLAFTHRNGLGNEVFHSDRDKDIPTYKPWWMWMPYR